jgi:glyoxylase-like metal-dependent hydrolase (beta-lactamase superfamily II)
MSKVGLGLGCAGVLLLAAWLTRAPEAPAWREIRPGVWRAPGPAYGYALVQGTSAVLIDAPQPTLPPNVRSVELLLLTHHHADTTASLEHFLTQKVPVRAPKASAEWLTPAGVTAHWQTSLPLRGSRTAYFVRPVGVAGVDATLADEQTITWREWTLRVLATPGHSIDHHSFLATHAEHGRVLFAGDALAERGKLWSPFTTDWDHWTDAGLKPTVASLRKLAGTQPSVILPAHGEPIERQPVAALEQTADLVAEVGYLKSFERFTKERLGHPPPYDFLVPKEQIASGGDKPWARVSAHLWLTGNTYVLRATNSRNFLLLDPWGQRSLDQLAKLTAAEQLGTPEVVAFTHAHYDHYDGVYLLPNRARFQVWALDRVAEPLVEPFRWRAPFLDARPIRFDRTFADGATAEWGGYRFRFHHLPGQSFFSMGIETTIDGKKCLFTADNFFHQDQFSGTGGWMGLNRSSPLPYAQSAQKVLDVAPDWVLAEHGGPFVFQAEDFRRRVRWGEAGAVAADRICRSGRHTHDWNPHRVAARPILHPVRPGQPTTFTLVVENVLPQADTVRVQFLGRGVMPDQSWTLEVPAGQTRTQTVTLPVPASLAPGRHAFTLATSDHSGINATEAFVVLEVPGG